MGGAVEWWQVDLGESTTVNNVELYHRTDCCQDRLGGAVVTVSATNDYTSGGTECGTVDVEAHSIIDCGGVDAQFVTVSHGSQYITICEAKVISMADSLVSNLVTASTEACAAAAEPVELTEGSTMYCDRDYVFTTLPDFLQGTILIPTANNDKRSDPGNTEFLCFDLADEATVYLLYDSRVEDGSEPSWMTSMFVGQHLSVAETTDTGMGSMEVWVYYAEEAGTVCLGGNNAPGIGSNYVVAVGRATVHTEVVGTVSGYSYIGCFIDSSSRDIEVGMGGLSGAPADRVMECAQRCTGYAYMGLQWDNECFCDNDYGGQGERDITSCDSDGEVGAFPDFADLAGVGNSARAGWTNAVYDVLYLQSDGSSGTGR